MTLMLPFADHTFRNPGVSMGGGGGACTAKGQYRKMPLLLHEHRKEATRSVLG